MNSPIFVTGAAGFIGFHLCRRLLDDGHTVVGIDHMSTAYPVSIRHARMAELRAHGGDFIFSTDDLCDRDALAALFRNHRPKRVCNLAAEAGVRRSLVDPSTYQKSNLEGFLNILECCRHFDAQRLVYASSSSVYGSNTKLPFAETDPVNTPLSYYAATKRANELIAYSYSHLFSIETIGLRFFTVYGPWGRPDMAMWKFAEKILRGETISLYNHGKMKRDFTYIDDIVAGVTAALFTDGLAPYELFNLGNHRSESLPEMVELLELALGKPAKQELLPMQPGDVPASLADVQHAADKLGFAPMTPLSVGLPRFCDWLITHPAIGDDVYQWRQSMESVS